MHSTLVFLVGCAMLGHASPLAGVVPSSALSPLYADILIIPDMANATLASHGTNSETNPPAAAADQDAEDDPAPPANPPSLNDLPACYVPCVKAGIKKTTQCTFKDVACICKNKTKIGKAAKECVVTECGLNNAIKVVAPAVKKLCNMDDKESEDSEEDWMRGLGEE
ncbi:hypothetical protein J3F83DRAFT_199326 [Trichoderma novae-zelandiae]